MGTAFSWPNGQGPQGRNPPGWPNRTEDADNQWFLDFMICEKFSVGTFERGPIAMGFEYHNQFTPPPKCKEGDRYDQASVLQWWYIDDAEVGEFMRQELGMPVVHVEIIERIENIGPVKENTWELIVGSNRSYMTAASYGPEFEPMPWLERLFWSQDDQLWQMDLTESLLTETVGGDGAVGEMHPPTLYGTWRPGTYASLVSVYSDYGLESKLKQYGDLKCEQQLES